MSAASLSLLGLVQRLADVERDWFLRGFVGDASAGPIYYSDERPDDDFDTLAPHGVAAVFAQYTAERDRARHIESEAASLDENSVRVHPEQGPVSLRWIMVHVIEEYARHNGHADLIRERIDGFTGD